MILKKLYQKIRKNTNPIQYWRSLGATIGKDCEFYPTTYLGTEPYLITIGDHVRLNAGVNLITHDGGVWVLREKSKDNGDIDLFGKIQIGNNCHIGTNAIIMPGVTIGDNCIIGCCAVVTKNIPDNSIAAGIPARIIENISEYEEKHKNEFEHTKNMTWKEKREYLSSKYGCGAKISE